MPKQLSGLATAFVFLFALLATAPQLLGQGARTISSAGRRIDEFNTVRGKAERDQMEREMGRGKRSEDELRRSAATKAQIKEDFETLQGIYNEAVTRLSAKDNPSTEYVGQIAGRISKLAERLSTNIAFPEGEPEIDKAPELGSDPRDFLRTACKDLYEFLTNPIFESGIMEVSEVVKARQTLERIEVTSSLAHRKFGKVD